MLGKIVITGGPCSGKSTLIKALEIQGHPVLHETAREIIRASEKHPKHLTGKIIEEQVKKENSFNGFLDRSVVDSIAYAVFFDDLELIRGAKVSSYREIFFLESVPYQKDSERFEDSNEAQRMNSLIRQAYNFYGYNPINVPLMAVEERINFILSRIKP